MQKCLRSYLKISSCRKSSLLDYMLSMMSQEYVVVTIVDAILGWINIKKYINIYKYENTKNKKLSNCAAFGTGQKTSAVVSAVLGIVFWGKYLLKYALTWKTWRATMSNIISCLHTDKIKIGNTVKKKSKG